MTTELDLARILLATQLYREATDASVAWWGVWLDQALAAGCSLASVELVASARGRRLGAAISRPADAGAVRAIDVMLSTYDVPAAERELLYAVALRASRRDHAFGLWAAQHADHFEGGWTVTGDLDLAFANSFAGEVTRPLEQLCEALERDEVRRMTRTIDGRWELEIDLADAPLEQAWDALAATFAPHATTPPSLRRWLEQAAAPRATLTARLGGEVAFGLAVPLTSSRELAAGLAAAGIPEANDEALAAIAGALAATPRTLVLAYDAGGLDALVAM